MKNWQKKSVDREEEALLALCMKCGLADVGGWVREFPMLCVFLNNGPKSLDFSCFKLKLKQKQDKAV